MWSQSRYPFSTLANLTELENMFWKFIWNQVRHRIGKNVMGNKAKSENIKIHDFKLHYKANVIKSTWYWKKTQNRSEDQWHRNKGIDPIPVTFSHLIFQKMHRPNGKLCMRCTHTFQVEKYKQQIKIEKMLNSTVHSTDANLKLKWDCHSAERLTFIKKSTSNECWRACGEKGNFSTDSGSVDLVQPLWDSV